MKMIARVVSKPHTQAMIRALREAGLTVRKDSAGYICEYNDKEIFRAMNGRNNYLVRMRDDLFV